MLAGALPDVVMECEFSRDPVQAQQRANANCGNPEAEASVSSNSNDDSVQKEQSRHQALLEKTNQACNSERTT